MNENKRYIVKDRLIIDTESRCIYDTSMDSQPIELTKQLFDILLYLCENAGIVLTYDRILGDIDPDGYAGNKETLQTQIKRLRDALKANFGANFGYSILKNKRGVGYTIDKNIVSKAPTSIDNTNQSNVSAAPSMTYDSNTGMPFTFAVFYSLVVVDNTAMKNKYETARFLLTGREFYSNATEVDVFLTDENIRSYLHGNLRLPEEIIVLIVSEGIQRIEERIERLNLIEIKTRRKYIENCFENQWFWGNNRSRSELNELALKAHSDTEYLAHMMLYSIQESQIIDSRMIGQTLRDYQRKGIDSSSPSSHSMFGGE